MGHKHSKPLRYLRGSGSTQAGPSLQPPDEAPPAYDCVEPTLLPPENVLAIIENVDAVMKDIMYELHNELGDSPDVLVAAGYIRQACTAAARTVARTMLPNMTHAVLYDDLLECRAGTMEMMRAIKRDVEAGKTVATVLILANAVTKAANKAKSGSNEYRTGAWAAILAAAAQESAGIIAIRAFKGNKRKAKKRK